MFFNECSLYIQQRRKNPCRQEPEIFVRLEGGNGKNQPKTPAF